MAQLTADRNTATRINQRVHVPLAANAVIFAGALVAFDALGNLVPASNVAGLVGAGRASESADNTGGIAGDWSINVDVGTFLWDNDGSVTRADIGGDAYMIDDQTVGAAGNSTIGRIFDVDADGVWIKNY